MQNSAILQFQNEALWWNFFFFSAATVFCKSLKNVRYQFVIEVQKEVPFLLEKLKDLYPFSIFWIVRPRD